MPDGAPDAAIDAAPPKMPTFVQPPARFLTSYGQTGGLTVADLNGDGFPDVAAFDPAANSGVVTSFISDGNGMFPTVVNGQPASNSTSVAIAAGLMGTTTMGAMTATNGNQVNLYHASGGALDYATSYNLAFPTNTVGQAAVMAGLDGGAKSWLIEGTNTMLVVSAPAAGTNFTTPGSQYLTGVSTKGVAVGKFRGANAPDIVAVGSDSTGPNAYVLLNNGSGAFGLPQTLPLASAPTAVATGDVDGGGVDFVVASATSVQVFLNVGSGTFMTTPAHTYAAPAMVTGVALADFNGDGKLDMAVSSNGADEVSILTGNGDGSFNMPVVFAAGQVVYGIGVADFNRDNKPDIVVSGFFGIYLLLNTTP